MIDPVSLIISGASLIISGTTAWLTLLRKGRVQMTQPTTVFFGPDGPSEEGADPKVYLRTLLYSSARRGQIVESMFVKVRRGEASQVFNIWVYGDERLVRGSGMYVGPEGVTCNHHFLLPKDGTEFSFQPGLYQIAVYASLVGQKTPTKLWETGMALTKEHAVAIREQNRGVYFDWGPESASYHAHIEELRITKIAVPQKLLESFVRHGEASADEPYRLRFA
jgi:hypothetical protein